ncbi:MAG: 4'-phosphopantetheinyl transferase superfamily protein [Lachnospiraceae bacterium]|nr:4'-phosphopantetheinyl transferase superfamily protein [Lachnospiraceae bacterium]
MLKVKYVKIDIEEKKKDKLYIEAKSIIPKAFNLALGYKSEKVKIQTILSKLLVVKSLNCSEDDIYYGKLGKPYVKGKKFFNISHSGDYIVYVESDDEIGIDIERIERRNLSIIDHAFTEEERSFIKGYSVKEDVVRDINNNSLAIMLNKENIEERFTYLWTIKEALFKASGTDVYIESSNIEIQNILKKIVNGVSEKDDSIMITESYEGKDYNICSIGFLEYVISIASIKMCQSIELSEYKLV